MGSKKYTYNTIKEVLTNSFLEFDHEFGITRFPDESVADWDDLKVDSFLEKQLEKKSIIETVIMFQPPCSGPTLSNKTLVSLKGLDCLPNKDVSKLCDLMVQIRDECVNLGVDFTGEVSKKESFQNVFHDLSDSIKDKSKIEYCSKK